MGWPLCMLDLARRACAALQLAGFNELRAVPQFAKFDDYWRLHDFTHPAQTREDQAADDFEAEYGGTNKLRGDGSRRQGFRFSRWRVVRYFALFRGGCDPRLDGGLLRPMDQTHEY